MVKTFALTFYMIIKWAKSKGIHIKTIFKFLNFPPVFTQSKAHLSDGIDGGCTFQIQTSKSLSNSAQGFLRMNTYSWVNSTILILLALNTRISYECLLQNLRMKHVILSDGICRTEEMHMNSQLLLILLIQHFKVIYHGNRVRKMLHTLNEHWL